jgi:hypothetical protein
MRKFFDFDGLKIPLRKDESTEIYLEVDGEAQRKPLTILLGDGSWAKQDQRFTINRLGTITTYQIALVEMEVDVHDKRGKYGQLRRRVLVAPVVDLETWAKSELGARGPA